MSSPMRTTSGATNTKDTSLYRVSKYARDRAVRPLARSPTSATFTPSSRPTSLWMVYTSSSAWVGCWPGPSPALMMGTDATAAAARAAPAVKWRSTMTSAYPSTVRMVSVGGWHGRARGC